MNKPTIAVDIDDVLANSHEAIRVAANEHLGANFGLSDYLLPNSYWGFYESTWKQLGYEGRITIDDLEDKILKDPHQVQPIRDGLATLQDLAKSFRLIVVTARRDARRDYTLEWLDRHFPDVFSEVIFGGGHEGIKLKSKGQLCAEQGASWLIDDSVEHAHSALEQGISVILFGEYGWHLPYEIHPEVVRCKNWQAVGEYFDAQG